MKTVIAFLCAMLFASVGYGQYFYMAGPSYGSSGGAGGYSTYQMSYGSNGGAPAMSYGSNGGAPSMQYYSQPPVYQQPAPVYYSAPSYSYPTYSPPTYYYRPGIFNRRIICGPGGCFVE